MEITWNHAVRLFCKAPQCMFSNPIHRMKHGTWYKWLALALPTCSVTPSVPKLVSVRFLWKWALVKGQFGVPHGVEFRPQPAYSPGPLMVRMDLRQTGTRSHPQGRPSWRCEHSCVQSTDGRRLKGNQKTSRGQGMQQTSKKGRWGRGPYMGSHTQNRSIMCKSQSTEKLDSCSGNTSCIEHVYI